MPVKPHIEDRMKSLLVALGSLFMAYDCIAQQNNLLTVQQGQQHLAVQRSAKTIDIEQRNSTTSERRVQRDLQRRERDTRLSTLTTRRQVQQSLLMSIDEDTLQAKEEALSTQASGVDERPLWNLLKGSRLSLFDQSLMNWRKRYPQWTPSTQLLDERQR